MRDNAPDEPGTETRRRTWRRPLAVAAAVVASSGLVFTGIAV